jgi:hypothetical protein
MRDPIHFYPYKMGGNSVSIITVLFSQKKKNKGTLFATIERKEKTKNKYRDKNVNHATGKI